MYLRTVQRQNKDGTVARYLQLAHNHRDSESGKVQAKILWSFGREEQVDRDGLRRLVDSINRFLDPEHAVAQGAQGAALQFRESRPLGGGWALHALWLQLGLDEAIRGVIQKRSFRVPVEKAIFAMVANRALAPSSKLAVEEWVREDVVLPGVEGVEVHNLYRAMDVLVQSGEALQKEVFFSVASLLNLEVDLLFLDTTSTYFEIEGQDPESEQQDASYRLRRFGHSKDHRPDRAQTVIGLAVTREGIPVRCWTWPGNTPDVNCVAQVKRDLVHWKLGRVVTVIDRGFTSEENLRELQRAGGHYIAGERMRSGKESVEEALSRQGRYREVNDRVHVKEILVGEGEARKRFVLVRNPRQAERDRRQREELLERLNHELEALSHIDRAEQSKAACRLLAHPAYGRFLKLDAKGRLELDKAKVRAEERLDGKYLLRTSDDTLDSADVALGYKQLLEVEEAFRTLKQVVDLRPVFHRLSRRIEAHVLLCWLALLLIRVAEVRASEAHLADYTWSCQRRELERMHLGVFHGDAGTVWQRTETREAQRQILKALRVDEPPRFFKVDPRTSL